MTSSDTPLGRLYGKLYLPQEKPRADDARARFRIAKLVPPLKSDEGLPAYIESEMGVPVPMLYGVTPDWQGFLGRLDILDLLHFVTFVYRFLKGREDFREKYGVGDTLAGTAARWVLNVRRIFAEQSLGYRIDDLGGVHPLVDRVYEMEAAATLASLNGARYRNVSEELSKGLGHLDSIPMDGKSAIRGVFAACEALFKLAFPSAPRLTREQMTKLLTPAVKKSGDRAADQATKGVVDGFCSWVDAAHWYRHEQGVEDPHQPPLALAVALISQGLAFIRWLGDLDREMHN